LIEPFDKGGLVLEVRRHQGLQTLPDGYQAVFERAGRESVFLSLPWFLNFEQTILAPHEHTLIYGVEEKTSPGRPLGIVVLRSSERRKGLLDPRTVESLTNYYTPHYGPVLAGDCHDVDVLSQAVASALWEDRYSWDVIRVQPLDPASPTYPALVHALRQRGMPVQTYFCFGNWYLELAGRSYREYCGGLPSVLRKNIPYLSRRLEKIYRVRITIVTAEPGLEEALDHYERLYAASWREAEPYPHFIRGLARTAVANGWLRLGLLFLDDEPAAAQFWLVHGGVGYIYKICYDERFAKFSVGTVLTARLMEQVIDVDKVSKVDYLSGDDDYKKNWMSHRAERWGILAFNPTRPKGIAHAFRHIGGRFVKRAAGKLMSRRKDARSGEKKE